MRISLVEAQKLFNQNKFTHSIPAALQALKFGQDAYGLNSEELLQPYILMAISSIGVGDLRQAETYLSQANWILVKSPDSGASQRSHLYRALGRLYHAKGNSAMALKLLADDVYHTSLDHGPDSINAAGGYYLMALVFEANGVKDASKAAFLKVAGVWLEFLQSPQHRSMALDVAQEAEALQQLSAIVQNAGCDGVPASTAALALALLHHSIGDTATALQWSQYAKQAATPDILQSIKQFEETL